MTILAKEKINISVDTLEKISNTDLADLCYNTEQAIKAGGGFGWITVPPRDVLKKYWNSMLLVSTNTLIVGRLNGDIAGSMQLSFYPTSNEAQKNISNIKSHFVAPWARGYGLAKAMIDYAILKSKENSKINIQLDIRETQTAAIQLFESKGFIRWGENPTYAFVNGNPIKGYYYHRSI
ncbi:GNAT family N-acetyltransferase [Pelagibacteraceae bacterium]|nr:GNAT family N-acetyltransferase [Pelagibacteraceae bacterium]|tara:strand:+ start:96 stop:632 length:537 start_codon:yes stop_codon:yes gene_type:complete